MVTSFISESLQETWNVFNIRGFMILSLFLQALLASMTPLRRKSTSRFHVFVIWSAYFLADWAATFTFGLISNAQRINSDSPVEVNKNLLACWAAFLLIHLGGPDTITAFSLEDNALWTRHLVGLVAQLFTFLYIFIKTLPDNNLVVPTILIAIAGTLKYAERTRSLYLASLGNLKKSTLKQPAASFDNLNGENFSDDKLSEAFHFFEIFKGLIVDITPNHEDRSKSREFFLHKEAKKVFDLMVTEIDLLYGLFYTKMSAVNSSWGIIVRFITSYSTIAALVLYCISKKEGFHSFDIQITYILFAGTVVLEMTGGMMLMYSNLNGPQRWFHYCWYFSQGLCFYIPTVMIVLVVIIFTIPCGCFPIFMKSWCEKLGAFNLLSHCVGQCRRTESKPNQYARMILNFITGATKGRVTWNAFDDEIRNFIFDELKERAFGADDANKVKEIYEARGIVILTKPGNVDDNLVRSVVNFSYDRSLLAWHVATEICHNVDGAMDKDTGGMRKFAVTLSDYMHYLLIKKPGMMSNVAGIGERRYRDTCAEIKHFCSVFKAETVSQFCTRILEEDTSIEPAYEYKDKGTSVLSDACVIARALRQKDEKWELISRVWLELLTYAAGHCRPENHARALSEGGEVVTFVWLLMAHFGIGPHFAYPEDER